ncbi:MAG: DUF4190 domain-containing protein [Marinoscillum sp.]
MKNIGLFLIVLMLLSACTSSRYACVDVYNTKKEKTPLKYRIGKAHPTQSVGLLENVSRDSMPESPAVASLEVMSIPLDQFELRKRDIQKLLEELPLPKKGALSLEEIEGMDKKELRKKVKSQLKTLPDPPEDENYKSAKNLAIISFVLSMVGLLFFPVSLAGLITGIVSLSKYKRTVNKENRIFAVLGVIFSSAWLALIVALIFLILIAFNNWSSSGWD